jgi:hypothetical protein
MAVLTLGSVAIAGNSAPASSPAEDVSQNSNIPVDLARAAINPVMLDDATPAPAAAPAPSEAAAAPASSSTPPEGAIMWGLDKVGVGGVLEKANIAITGYGDIGYFYDATVPHNIAAPRSAPPTFILFPGDYKNQFTINQLDLAIQRTIADPSKLDFGFMVEGIWGRDAVYVHSNGILDNGNKHGNTSPDEDLDLEQAYVNLSLPLGSGLTLTAGKFDTLLGYEVINPTGNPLYTHSYMFSYGVPFTQTGILAAYNITPALKLTAGITRGWNQSTDDNNGAIDFLGQLAWTVNSAINVTLNLSEGPQSTGDNHDYWTVVEGIVTWQVADQLKLAGDFLYGDANAIAQWYGAAGYATYTPGGNKYLAVNLRGEFYHDGRGFTTGVGGSDTNYIEGTLGFAVTPTPDVNLLQTLTIRPEVRVDLADHGVYDGRKFTQLTAGVDAYVKF